MTHKIVARFDSHDQMSKHNEMSGDECQGACKCAESNIIEKWRHKDVKMGHIRLTVSQTTRPHVI